MKIANAELQSWIADKGLTQEAFARKARISRPFAGQILGGTRRPSPEVARRIARLTGIPLERLLFPTRGRRPAQPPPGTSEAQREAAAS